MPDVVLAELRDSGSPAALAASIQSDTLLPMDDVAGRAEASQRGLRFTGTLGIGIGHYPGRVAREPGRPG